MQSFRTTAIAVTLAAQPALAGFTTSDIDNWVGTGANQAVLVIDWNDGINPVSLAWGYRFDGSATGEDMLLAIASVDTNLYARVASFGFGDALIGLGYDVDSDGFAISDGTTFADGVAFAGTSDTATSTDSDDHYKEGWASSGFWTYWTAEANPYTTDWTSAATGFGDRVLTDGSWDGYSFDAAFSFTDAPTAPIPAPATVFVPAALAGIAARRRRG